jgi:hypothetical protein
MCYPFPTVMIFPSTASCLLKNLNAFWLFLYHNAESVGYIYIFLSNYKYGHSSVNVTKRELTAMALQTGKRQ